MSFDEPTGLRTSPLPAVHVESPPRRAFPFTSVAFVSAMTLLIMQGVAINLATSGNPGAATVLAHVLNGLTAVPFVLGIVGLVRGPHRAWASAAMIVSVIANPFLLRSILSFFGGL